MDKETAQRLGAVLQQVVHQQLLTGMPTTNIMSLLAIASCHARLQLNTVLDHPNTWSSGFTSDQKWSGLAYLVALRVLTINVRGDHVL